MVSISEIEKPVLIESENLYIEDCKKKFSIDFVFDWSFSLNFFLFLKPNVSKVTVEAG